MQNKTQFLMSYEQACRDDIPTIEPTFEEIETALESTYKLPSAGLVDILKFAHTGEYYNRAYSFQTEAEINNKAANGYGNPIISTTTESARTLIGKFGDDLAVYNEETSEPKVNENNEILYDITKGFRLNSRKNNGTHQKIIDGKTNEYTDRVIENNQTIFTLGLYYGNRRSNDNLMELRGFAVDLDIANEDTIKRIMEDCENNRLPKFNFISPSGTGLHLWYVLDKPIGFRDFDTTIVTDEKRKRKKKRTKKEKIDFLNNIVQTFVEQNFNKYCNKKQGIDKLTITQGYRIPGSPVKSKYGVHIMKSYQYSTNKNNIEDLINNYTNINLTEADLERIYKDISPAEWERRYKEMVANKETANSNSQPLQATSISTPQTVDSKKARVIDLEGKDSMKRLTKALLTFNGDLEGNRYYITMKLGALLKKAEDDNNIEWNPVFSQDFLYRWSELLSKNSNTPFTLQETMQAYNKGNPDKIYNYIANIIVSPRRIAQYPELSNLRQLIEGYYPVPKKNKNKKTEEEIKQAQRLGQAKAAKSRKKTTEKKREQAIIDAFKDLKPTDNTQKKQLRKLTQSAIDKKTSFRLSRDLEATINVADNSRKRVAINYQSLEKQAKRIADFIFTRENVHQFPSVRLFDKKLGYNQSSKTFNKIYKEAKNLHIRFYKTVEYVEKNTTVDERIQALKSRHLDGVSLENILYKKIVDKDNYDEYEDLLTNVYLLLNNVCPATIMENNNYYQEPTYIYKEARETTNYIPLIALIQSYHHGLSLNQVDLNRGYIEETKTIKGYNKQIQNKKHLNKLIQNIDKIIKANPGVFLLKDGIENKRLLLYKVDKRILNLFLQNPVDFVNLNIVNNCNDINLLEEAANLGYYTWERQLKKLAKQYLRTQKDIRIKSKSQIMSLINNNQDSYRERESLLPQISNTIFTKMNVENIVDFNLYYRLTNKFKEHQLISFDNEYIFMLTNEALFNISYYETSKDLDAIVDSLFNERNKHKKVRYKSTEYKDLITLEAIKIFEELTDTKRSMVIDVNLNQMLSKLDRELTIVNQLTGEIYELAILGEPEIPGELPSVLLCKCSYHHLHYNNTINYATENTSIEVTEDDHSRLMSYVHYLITKRLKQANLFQ